MSYLMISFNDALANDIISFEQLGPNDFTSWAFKTTSQHDFHDFDVCPI